MSVRGVTRAVAVLVALVLAASCTKPPPPTRVVVIGLDGATWDVARPMIAAGELPNLARLIARGVTATPIADEPLFAPVAWTTLFTGVPPAQHGVENWALAGSGYRKVPALWSRLDAAGKSAVLVNVPGTWKAERLAHGVVVADLGMARGYVGGAGGGTFFDVGAAELPRPYDGIANLLRLVAPPLAVGEWSDWVDVAEEGLEPSVFRVKRLDETRAYVSPMYPADLGVWAIWPKEVADELAGFLGVPYIREGPAWSAFGDGEVPAIFADHLAQTTGVQVAAAHRLLKTKPWDLFVWVDPLPDRIEHAYWSEHDPTQAPDLDPARRDRHRERVRTAYRDADTHVGEFVAHAPNSWVVVVSAHGFGPSPGHARGDHAKAGMAIVSGPGLSGDAGEISLVDVAPTIACLLGISADGMAGSALTAVRSGHPGCR
jgi:predicted AlkP superfamily phosphohydrolase/phosphomutase